MLLWLESGRPLEVMLIASALTGTEPRALVAVQDLSARKRAEAALRAEAIVREESVRKDEFMATLSHELRNPLAPIRTSVTVLERGGPHSDEEQRALAVLHRQVDHLVRIVDDLLDATRIARGKVLLQRDAVDLGELARRLVEDYRRGFEARGVALSVQVEPPAPIWVSGDPTRLNQILGNLLGNSLKFTPAGGHVDVRLRREASSAFLIVRDDGVGIAAGVRRRLFQPFIQAPQSLERSHGGLGLGLVMVKGLAELHGGGVHVESEGVGRGATFTVRLPLIPAPLAVGPRPTPGGGRHNSGPLRVLVIEDNVDAGDMLRDLLALDGHEVEVAYDGRSGLELSRDFRPDVVLCDLGLPGMDGFEVARAMRSDPQLRGVHLVALSGYTRPEDRDRALAAGFDAHVPKPLNPEVLERVLRG
jgi:two-component system CheB/CheR fusion protein